MPDKPNDLRERFSAVCRSHGLVAVFAYGSRATEIDRRLHGDETDPEHPKSDLDLGVLPVRDDDFDVRDIVKFAIAVEDLFEVPRADIVDLRTAPPYLALDAIRGERVFCADEYEAANFELFVLRRAGDLAFHERQRRRLLLTPAGHKTAAGSGSEQSGRVD